MKRRSARLTGILGVMMLAVTGCGAGQEISPDPSASDYGVVRIGKGIGADTEVIAYIYADILQQTGYTTEVVDSGSTRQEYLDTMAAGGENAPLITPDYSGSLLLQLTEDGAVNPTSTASAEAPSVNSEGQPSSSPSPTGINVNGMSSNDILSTLPRVLPQELGVLDAAPAENKDALVVTKATAAKYELSTVNDLAEHCKDLTFGVPEGFQQRGYGAAGLKQLYGCEPKKFVVQNDQGKLVNELAHQNVDVADIFTASSAIKDNNFTVLEDPQANFIAQQVLPVVTIKNLPDSIKAALNNVTKRLSTSDLVFLNHLTSGDAPVSAEDAAKFWLDEGDR